jgi:hypothetical protein
VREEVARLERAREEQAGDGGRYGYGNRVWRDLEGHAHPMVRYESPG